MSLISKADFLAQDDATYGEIEVSGWGTIRVRSLSGVGRDIYMKGIMEWKEDGTHRVKTEDSEARLLSVTLVDEDGKLWFDTVEEGVKLLREKNAGSLQTAFMAAMELSGLQEEDLPDAVENLDETPSEEHGSN